MDRTRGVAVLGAGMAGAVAARRLADAGLGVHVFDKGRGVGGRMATRRGDDGAQFDHGAQFVRAHGPAFAARLEDWERRGVVAPWAGDGRRVGVPGMTAPVRDLLAGLPVRSGTAVTGLAGGPGAWRVADAEGAEHGPFAAVAVTFPAPQAAALLGAGGRALPGVEIATYAPCWSLMLTLEAAPASLVAEPLVQRSDGPIGLIALDSSKPGRPPGARLTVHAGPGWSRDHLQETREAVAAELTRLAAEHLGADLRPRRASAHRWRYAAVETALGRPCLYDPGARLGAAGDWCLGPRVEAAHDSGLALADAILADLRADAPGPPA